MKRLGVVLWLIVRRPFNEPPAAVEEHEVIGDDRVTRIERVSLLKLSPRRTQIAAQHVRLQLDCKSIDRRSLTAIAVRRRKLLVSRSTLIVGMRNLLRKVLCGRSSLDFRVNWLALSRILR